MGMNSLRIDLPFQKRCEMCHKPKKFLYKIELDGYSVFVCSAHCAEEARSNWQEKKDRNITPGTPILPSTDVPEVLNDNTELE